MRCTLRKNKAFTFIEIIIVTLMLAFISLGMYGLLNNGINIWKRVNQGSSLEDLNLFLERFTSDVRNVAVTGNIKFQGHKESLELPTLFASPRLGNIITPGKVAYSYDRQSGTLNRLQLDYSELYRQSGDYNPKSVAHIESLSLEYYLFDTSKREQVWLAEWSEEALPSAIRINFDYDDGAQILHFTKTVAIPVGG